MLKCLLLNEHNIMFGLFYIIKHTLNNIKISTNAILYKEDKIHMQNTFNKIRV